ncbi:YIP1 family protein [Natronomonas gomsonensis]|uniref:YIP1 family protein n=1 Tax=Natronomonas gomsonensis TaxID=1046043 RepID=UPI0020CA574B|nr:YIP1 family protein [Natronomonas gomsonensis]MCY4732051.1 YIP1 family protein [Natronomonas gomsonensis]
MALYALRDLLVSPREFFESRRPESLTFPALGAIVLVAVITAGGLWAVMQLAVVDLPPEGRRAFRRVFGTVLVVLPFVMLVSWAILAGVVYLLVRGDATEATYSGTFGVVGLAALLEIPATIIGFVRAYMLFASVSFSDPETAQRQLEAAASGEDPLVLLVWIGVTLWKGYVWREGLLGAYDLPSDRATLAAGVAVGFSLLMVLFG